MQDSTQKIIYQSHATWLMNIHDMMAQLSLTCLCTTTDLHLKFEVILNATRIKTNVSRHMLPIFVITCTKTNKEISSIAKDIVPNTGFTTDAGQMITAKSFHQIGMLHCYWSWFDSIHLSLHNNDKMF